MGVIVNVAVIIIGGLIGLLLKKGIPEKIHHSFEKCIGLCVLMIGFKGIFDGKNSLITILSMIIGTLIGDLIDIDDKLDRVAQFAESKFVSPDKESRFATGFVTASLLFCIGAMAVVGSLDCGLKGDNSTLYTKSILDGVTSVVLASGLGFGVIFSSVPILVIEGGLALLAGVLSPILTQTIVAEMSCVGSLLIIALGLNMLKICKFKVANYLPAIFMPILLCQFIH